MKGRGDYHNNRHGLFCVLLFVRQQFYLSFDLKYLPAMRKSLFPAILLCEGQCLWQAFIYRPEFSHILF